ncbi:MAG: 2TM domain-containing protein [Saprospiraceae bacterium]
MAKKIDPVKLAEKRVKDVKEFYTHLWAFILCNIFLIALNLLISPGFMWSFIPLLGWGIGLAFHTFEVFGYPGMGRNWEERMLEKEARKIEEQNRRLGVPEEEKLDLPELKKKPEELYKDDELV